MNIIASSTYKKGVVAACLVEEGHVVEKIVKVADTADPYVGALYAFELSILLLRKYVEERRELDVTVCIELSNSVVTSWLQSGNVRDQNYEDYTRVTRLLDEIPLTYYFGYNAGTIAMRFCDRSEIKKEKIYGLEDIDA